MLPSNRQDRLLDVRSSQLDRAFNRAAPALEQEFAGRSPPGEWTQPANHQNYGTRSK